MSDQYIPPNTQPNAIPNPTRVTTNPATRPSISGAGLDPHRGDFRADRETPVTRGTGGFGTGTLVAIVFVVIAVMAAVLFNNPNMLGFGRDVAPVEAPMGSAGGPADIMTAPVAPTPAPAPARPPVPAPGQAPVSPAAPPAPMPGSNP